MKSTKRMLAAAGLAATLLFAAGARGDVLEWGVFADTFAGVPNSSGPFNDSSGLLFGPPGNTEASASLIIASDSPGTETADGAANAFVDPLFFNGSQVGARSKVSTGGVVSAVQDPCGCGLFMFDTSTAAFGAFLSNPLDGGATVDLTLHIQGSLILRKPATDTGLFNELVCDPEDETSCTLISDMEASVLVSILIGDLSDPEAPVVQDLFFGTALLEWVPILGEDGEPIPGMSEASLYTEGSFTNDMFVMTDGEGNCTATQCEANVDILLTFTDVQSLGFGQEFEVAMLIETDANQFSAVGRESEANFFDTVSIVDLTFLPQQVPAPGSLLLLGLGLLGIAATRRRRTLH